MAIEITSLEEKRDQILTDIESFTNQDTPSIEVAFNRILANAQGGMSLQNQLYTLDKLAECFPQTASEYGLSLHAELKNTARGLPSSSEAYVAITGTVGETVGTYSTGPQWSANGYLFETSVGGVFDSNGELTIEVVSIDTGSKTTLSVDQTVELTTTITNINNEGTVTEIISNGEDEQGLESWRQDIIRAYAFPPNMGTASWFYNKSLEVSGITRCFPYVDPDNLGRVLLYLADDSKTGGLPSQSQIDEVEALFSTSDNNVMWAYKTLPNGLNRVDAFESEAESFTVSITDGIPALSASLKVQIESAIDTYFNQREPYINGLSLYNYGYVSKTDIVTVVQNTINSQTGSTGRFTDLEVTRTSGGTTQDIYTLTNGNRASGVTLFV